MMNAHCHLPFPPLIILLIFLHLYRPISLPPSIFPPYSYLLRSLYKTPIYIHNFTHFVTYLPTYPPLNNNISHYLSFTYILPMHTKHHHCHSISFPPSLLSYWREPRVDFPRSLLFSQTKEREARYPRWSFRDWGRPSLFGGEWG